MKNKTREKIIGAIDIGEHKIRVAIATQNDDTGIIKILGLSSIENKSINKDVITDLDELSKTIKKVVEKCEEVSGKDIGNVFTGVGGSHINTIVTKSKKQIQDPNTGVLECDIDNLISYAQSSQIPYNKKLIDVVMKNFSLDGKTGIKNPLNMIGSELEAEVLLITGDRLILQNYKKVIEDDLMLENKTFVFEPLASSLAVLTEKNRENGVILIDIGNLNINASIFYNSKLVYTKNWAIGAYYLATDLCHVLSVTKKEATRLLEEFNSLYDPTTDTEVKTITKTGEQTTVRLSVIHQVIDARIKDIFLDHIKPDLKKNDYYNNPLYDLESGIVLIGGGSKVKSIEKTVSHILELETKIGISNDFEGKSEIISDPENATILGLIRYGFDYLKKNKISIKVTKKSKEREEGMRIGPKDIIGRITKFFQDNF